MTLKLNSSKNPLSTLDCDFFGALYVHIYPLVNKKFKTKINKFEKTIFTFRIRKTKVLMWMYVFISSYFRLLNSLLK